ncbi:MULTISPECIES: hypothetical protein [Campylobacter]|uniref:Uncharacterized protein n=1 Tax=Campylobacter vicugnae TaxID=1660076 RepID=A0ABZ2E8P5_9BACT|nr:MULTISPECIES: hypothetical protein [unclassified Campylobacter]ARR03529.1 hypothetical protein CVIC12175_0381 [Campylobacter sp. RM12175]MCR8690270.1 hypothetical protein [Campylobacter sp. RM9264]MCR8701901.1 hypothetical protein [Campylobacter sp. RM12176]
MSYSFIKPKIKPLFSIFTKIWLWAMIILSILSIFWAIFLGVKIYIVNSNSQDLQAQYDEKLKAIDSIKEQTKITLIKRDMTLDIYNKNAILNKSLMNLFNLVPDGVTLNSVYLDNELLKIKGVTPTKDHFKLLFEAPLKSIFAVSNTTFYQLPNGWYNFVSINKIDATQMENLTDEN